MNPSSLEIVATVIFGTAVLHTFLVKKFESLAHRYSEGSVGENIFHFLAEVEVVFGLWAAVFLGFYSYLEGFIVYDQAHRVIGGAIHFLEKQNYTEPVFVFVIMCMAGTRPVIMLAESVIKFFSRWIPADEKMSFYIAALIVGPLLGSFITEPAAMTVTALILLNYFYAQKMSEPFKYATLGLLFVNISIGGTLTHFAAPPVLMVANKWHWGMGFMASHFGYKAALSVIVCTLATAFYFKKELQGALKKPKGNKDKMTPTFWITIIHLIFLGLVVYTSHHMVFFVGLFLFFLGFMEVTKEYQEKPKLKESLLVGFFLGGLVTLGSLQGWWLKEVLAQLGDLALFFGATSLTAITDNAALTYLGSLVELTEAQKYNLVAGAVTGGGLTVIANAPNPAGFGILKDSFGKDGINPLGLLAGALLPTLVACVCFLTLPSPSTVSHGSDASHGEVSREAPSTVPVEHQHKE